MNCPTCGAALSGADLEKPACHYCGTVHPHIARAAEKVEVVKQLLAPGPGGVPAAMQGMFPPGMLPGAPMPGAPPGQPGMVPQRVFVSNGMVVSSFVGSGGAPQGSPPAFGGPVGAGAPPAYGGPMIDPTGLQRAGAETRRALNIVMIVVLVSFLMLVLVGASVALFVLR